MASGSFNVSTSNQYVVGRVDWSSTPNTDGNYSDVYCELRMWRTNSGYTTYGTGTWYLTIDGTQTSSTTYVSLTQNSNTFVMSHSKRVYHNADGTMSTIIAWSGGINGVNTLNASSSTAYLDTIPRASTISSFPAFNLGVTTENISVNVSINRASSSFTHTLHMYCGSTFIKEFTGIGASATLTLTQAEYDVIYQQIPNSTSAGMTLYCLTWNGGTQIGGWTSVGGTAYVPSGVNPTVSTVAHSEGTSSPDIKTIVGKYVQNLSKLNLAVIGALGVKYSTISSYSITFDGSTYNGSSVTTSLIKSSGTTLPIVATVTDSRGRTASVTVNVEVLTYANPLITEFSLSRCKADGSPDDVGTYVKVVSKGSVSQLTNTTERNTLTYTVYSRLRGDTTWTTKKTSTLTVGTISLNAGDVVSTYDAITSFDFRLDITDKFNTTISLTVLPTSQVTMSWNKTGIGVGKVWQQGALDVGGDAYVSGNLNTNLINGYSTNGLLNQNTYKNVIMNSNFDIWQRWTTANSGYSFFIADRWLVTVSSTASNITGSRQTFAMGQTVVPNNPKYFLRLQVVSQSGGNWVALQQPIENVDTLNGQTVTLSFWAKSDANRNINIYMQQYFGTGGSPSTQVDISVNPTCALTTSWTKYTYTFNIPSCSGKTKGTNKDDKLNLGFGLPVNTPQIFDIAQVQLEVGSQATPYQPKTFQEELMACQRYFEKSYDYEYQIGIPSYHGMLTSYAKTGYEFECGDVQYKVTKRVVPTVTYFNPDNGNVNQARDMTTGVAGDARSLATNASQSSDKQNHCYSPGTITPGRQYNWHWVADAEL